MKIGFYNEDLPDLILKIADLAETLSCDIGLNSPIWDFNDMDVRRRFFGGVFVARYFNLEGFEYFRNSVTSGGDDILIPYMWQTLNGEQILHAEIDGVSIPIKSINQLLTSQEKTKTKDRPEELRSSHNKNKTDHEKGSEQSAVAKK